MTRAEAIRRFEDMKKAGIAVLDSGFGTHPGENDALYRRRIELAEIALEALSEQERRDRGCEYCRGEKELYQHTHTTKLHVNTFGAARTLEVECVPCPPYANCCMKEVPARSAFIIRYCPECGRKLDGGEADA